MTLCTGFRSTHLRTQLWQAGSHEYDRQATLCRPVQCRDKCSKLVFLHVLQFVNEQHECGTSALRGGAHDLEQGLQVMLEVAVVSKAPLRIEVEAHHPRRPIRCASASAPWLSTTAI